MEGVEETDGARTGARRARPSLDADILDRLGDAILVTDMQGRYVEVNLAATRLLGYSRAELLEMSIGDVAAWPVERAEAEFERFTATGMWRDQVELRRKDGSTVTVDARASVIETADGRWGLAILREPDPAIVELREAERRLAALVRSSDDAIYSVSPEGVIETWNPAAERLYGYRADEIVGRHVRTTAPPERHEEVQRNIDRVLRGERVEGFETVRLRKDGRRIEVALTISPILDPDGRVIGMSTIGRDVGERIRAERWARSLTELSTALREAGSLEELLDAALDTLQRTLRAGQVGVLLAEDGSAIRFRAWRGLSAELRSVLEDLDLPAAAGTGPLSVPDVRLEERFAASRDAFERVGCRSFAAIALAHPAEPVGAVVMCSDRAGELPPDELGFAVALCAQLSVALARLRAERELEAARDTLDLLTASAADGITIQDTSGALVYANLSAARLTGYESVESFLAADPAERIADVEMFDERGEPFPLERLPGRRVLQGEPESEAILLVRNRRTGRSFWSLVKASASFDERGAVRYAINLFHDVTWQKRAELTSQLRAHRMAQLYSFTAALSSTTDARVAAEALADLTETGFAADRGAVLLRADDDTTLEPLSARGFPPGEGERLRGVPLDRRTPIGQAVLSNEPVVMSDAEAWRGMYPDLDEALPPAAAAIPLDVGDRAIGVVLLAYDEPRGFDDDDVVFMQAAAHQGA
jgi:PAS domain S-box-containing protein